MPLVLDKTKHETGETAWRNAFGESISPMQDHISVLQEGNTSFKGTVNFNHHCQMHFGQHKICYLTAAACRNTITFPFQHMIYEYFKVVIERFHLEQQFSRVLMPQW